MLVCILEEKTITEGQIMGCICYSLISLCEQLTSAMDDRYQIH